jgi:hypothetical protein
MPRFFLKKLYSGGRVILITPSSKLFNPIELRRLLKESKDQEYRCSL